MRVKRGFVSHRRHKKLLLQTKGYRMTRSRLIKVAKEAQLHAGVYAYAGRRKKKSDFRRLWIVRISEATKQAGLPYSEFVNKMKKANIIINRKMLSYLLIEDKPVFDAIVDRTK